MELERQEKAKKISLQDKDWRRHYKIVCLPYKVKHFYMKKYNLQFFIYLAGVKTLRN
jgi:hypothetical protein